MTIRQRIAVMAVGLISLAFSAAQAAVVRTTAGVELVGDLTSEVLRLQTATGLVEIPKAALLQVRRADGSFEVLLVDDTRLSGEILDESLRLKVGMVFQVVIVSDLDVLMLTPPGFPVGVLESAFLPLELYRGRDTITTCPIRFQLDGLPALSAKKGNPIATPKSRYFSCDSLSIIQLELAVDRSRKGMTLEVDGTISVLKSFDKWARVTVELVAGGKLLGRGQKFPIDAEERKNTTFSLPIVLKPAAVDEALAAGAPIVARVRVDVARNGDVEYLQVWGVSMKGASFDEP